MCSFCTATGFTPEMCSFLGIAHGTHIPERIYCRGERNWVQVVCNGGVASLMALFYMMDCGCGEHPVDLVYNYRCSWLSLAILGALSCCNGDTWASEIGTVLSTGDPILITSLQSVPRGTNGGISFIGLVVSLLGGLVVGIGHYLTLLMCVSNPVMISAPPQWPIIFVGAAGGLMGSLIDSVLGATMQFSGITGSDNKGVTHCNLNTIMS
nr:transmembrane protein 19-like [Cherax quadricarinatus]